MRVSSPQIADIIPLVTPSIPAVLAILRSVIMRPAVVGLRVPVEVANLDAMKGW